ncbi:hypothetical protein B0J12DRAFT_33097 [Macrophomina phaseolina]|uniref:Uncharacterized protein n=1 Tax=Macrophomina phaseolina TaxID=35725 RepID=A0ABQ8GVS8_9PEZI|nr:hypothetical protein B0J12DRAFT_33097 [Macrophomina phaseolina]
MLMQEGEDQAAARLGRAAHCSPVSSHASRSLADRGTIFTPSSIGAEARGETAITCMINTHAKLKAHPRAISSEAGGCVRQEIYPAVRPLARPSAFLASSLLPVLPPPPVTLSRAVHTSQPCAPHLQDACRFAGEQARLADSERMRRSERGGCRLHWEQIRERSTKSSAGRMNSSPDPDYCTAFGEGWRTGMSREGRPAAPAHRLTAIILHAAYEIGQIDRKSQLTCRAFGQGPSATSRTDRDEAMATNGQ